MLTRDTSYGWDTIELPYNGTLEAHRDETFNSHFEYDNKVTTFNSAGNVQSTSGTLTYGKTSSGTLTRSQNNQETYWRIHDDPNSHLGTYNHFTQDATETYAYNGQWSKNLATNVPTTIANTGTTTGNHEAHLIHEEYVGNIETGSYLDYEDPFDHDNTYSYANTGAWGTLMGEHGFTPGDLSTLDHSGTIPLNTDWDIGPQLNPTNNIPYEGPDGVAFEEPEDPLEQLVPKLHITAVDAESPLWEAAEGFLGAFPSLNPLSSFSDWERSQPEWHPAPFPEEKIAKDREYALLAADVYKGAFEKQLATLGWQRDGDFELDPDTGFQAAVYINDSGEVVLVFAGTEATSIADWIANLQQSMFGYSEQYEQAFRYYNAKKAELGHIDRIVGHSLGGGLASSVSVITHTPATTFNAAGVNRKTVARHGGSLDDAWDLIDAYRVDGEVLSTLQDLDWIQALTDWLPMYPETDPMADSVGNTIWLNSSGADPVTLHSMEAAVLPAFELWLNGVTS